jgi:subtilisin family serine protease
LFLETLEDRTVLSTSTVQTALGAISYDTGSVSTSSILVDFTNTNVNFTGYSTLDGTSVETKLDLLPGYYMVHVGSGVSINQALSAYAASGLVSAISPDFLLSTQSTPSAGQLSQQWALQGSSPFGIDATTAWNVTTGKPRTVVAVTDTGIDYTHPDLYQNIWINQGEIPADRRKNLVSFEGNGIITMADLNNPANWGVGKIEPAAGHNYVTAADLLAPMKLDSHGNDTGLGGWATGKVDPTTGFVDDIIGWNFVANNNNPLDDNGHGTHVAGIIGAMGTSSGTIGVDPNALLMPLKFMNASGVGSIGAYIAAVDYAVQEGARIVNNSWAGGGFTTLLQNAITNAQASGVIFVAAAGNGSTNIDTNPTYPASYTGSNMVVVASSSRTGALSSFSNFGTGTVQVAAPGEGILSTLPNNQYGQLSGTSMAAPEVTGTLALIWAVHPNWTYTQVINQLLSTVQKDSQLDGKVSTGGIIDAANAVGALTPAAPTVLGTDTRGPSPYTLNMITVAFSQSIDPATMTASAIQLKGPSGQAIALTSIQAVGGSNNTKWNLMFATQNTPGTYTFQLAKTIKDTQGTALAGFSTSYSIPTTVTYANKTGGTIPDTGTLNSPTDVTVTGTVQTIALKVNISHVNDGDLVLYLVAPNGQKVLLASKLGGSGSDYTNTVFADTGTSKSITEGSAPFTGTFKPMVPLSTLQGVAALGTWKLQVQTLGPGAGGTLLNWSITITLSSGATVASTGTTASVQSVGEDVPATGGAAILTATVRGPGVMGMQLVTPLSGPGGTGSNEVPTSLLVNPGWLVPVMAGMQGQEPSESPVVQPAPEEVEASSDALFQQPQESVGSSLLVGSAPSSSADNIELDLDDLPA